MALTLAPTAPNTTRLTDLFPEILHIIDSHLDDCSRVCFSLAYRPYYYLITKTDPLRSFIPTDPRGLNFRQVHLYGNTDYEKLLKLLVVYLPIGVLWRFVRDNINNPPHQPESQSREEYQMRGFYGQWMNAKKALDRRLA